MQTFGEKWPYAISSLQLGVSVNYFFLLLGDASKLYRLTSVCSDKEHPFRHGYLSPSPFYQSVPNGVAMAARLTLFLRSSLIVKWVFGGHGLRPYV